jgi:hypothetical protein
MFWLVEALAMVDTSLAPWPNLVLATNLDIAGWRLVVT